MSPLLKRSTATEEATPTEAVEAEGVLEVVGVILRKAEAFRNKSVKVLVGVLHLQRTDLHAKYATSSVIQPTSATDI